jgi:hypothetical protein
VHQLTVKACKQRHIETNLVYLIAYASCLFFHTLLITSENYQDGTSFLLPAINSPALALLDSLNSISFLRQRTATV